MDNSKAIKIYEFIEVIVLIVLGIFIVYSAINYMKAYRYGWTSETRYWVFIFITLILIMVFFEIASILIKGKYFDEVKKEEKKPFNKNMITLYIGIILVLSGGVAVVYLIALIPPKDIKNYYIVIIVGNILAYSGLILSIITNKSRRVEKPTPPIGRPRLKMLSDGEILEKRIRYCFKSMFSLILFLFTLFQVFLFIFFISFNLVVLFYYLGFLIVISILLYIIVIIRKRIFSHESGFSINKEKVINEINKYNQKVKPCFNISIIALIILFVIIILVASYSTIFILFYLPIGLMVFLMLLNLPLYAFGKLLNSALSNEAND